MVTRGGGGVLLAETEGSRDSGSSGADGCALRAGAGGSSAMATGLGGFDGFAGVALVSLGAATTVGNAAGVAAWGGSSRSVNAIQPNAGAASEHSKSTAPSAARTTRRPRAPGSAAPGSRRGGAVELRWPTTVGASAR